MIPPAWGVFPVFLSPVPRALISPYGGRSSFWEQGVWKKRMRGQRNKFRCLCLLPELAYERPCRDARLQKKKRGSDVGGTFSLPGIGASPRAVTVRLGFLGDAMHGGSLSLFG